MLTNQQIIATVETAFLPIHCVADVANDGQTLRFKVFSRQGKVILSMRGMAVSEMREQKQLDAMLYCARSRIRAKGFVLKKLQATPPASP